MSRSARSAQAVIRRREAYNREVNKYHRIKMQLREMQGQYQDIVGYFARGELSDQEKQSKRPGKKPRKLGGVGKHVRGMQQLQQQRDISLLMLESIIGAMNEPDEVESLMLDKRDNEEFADIDEQMMTYYLSKQ